MLKSSSSFSARDLSSIVVFLHGCHPVCWLAAAAVVVVVVVVAAVAAVAVVVFVFVDGGGEGVREEQP